MKSIASILAFFVCFSAYAQEDNRSLAESIDIFIFQKDTSTSNTYNFDIWYLIDEKNNKFYRLTNCLTSAEHSITEKRRDQKGLYVATENKSTYTFLNGQLTMTYLKDGVQTYTRPTEELTKEDFLKSCGDQYSSDEVEDKMSSNGYAFNRAEFMKLYNAQKFDEALAKYEYLKFGKQGGEDVELIASIANIYFSKQNFEDALSTLTLGLLSMKDNAVLLKFRSSAYYYNGDLENAFLDARKCVELSPENAENLHQLAFMLVAKKDFEKAIQTSNQAKTMTQDRALLARLYQVDYTAFEGLELHSSAHQAIMMANQQNPNDWGIYSQCAYSLWKNAKDYQGAKLAYDRLMEAYKDNAQIFYQAAEVYAAAGLNAEGCQLLQKAFGMQAPSGEQAMLRRQICR